MKEILRLQNTTNLLIPRLPFQRLVREILQKFLPDGRVQRTSLEALQEATEIFMTTLFEDASFCANHAKRVTIYPKDMDLVILCDRKRNMKRPGSFFL